MSQKDSGRVAPADAVDLEIDRWFVENFYNSPISQQTHLFNLVRDAVAELKLRLKEKVQ